MDDLSKNLPRHEYIRRYKILVMLKNIRVILNEAIPVHRKLDKIEDFVNEQIAKHELS